MGADREVGAQLLFPGRTQHSQRSVVRLLSVGPKDSSRGDRRGSLITCVESGFESLPSRFGAARTNCQVGLADSALILRGVPRQLAAAVALLATPLTPAELSTLLPKVDRAWLTWLLARLQDAGLLQADRVEAAPPVLVSGAGALAEAVATGLGTAGLRVSVSRPGDPLVTALEDAATDPALVVVASAAAEPDRGFTDTLFRSGQPHLIVRLEPDRAVVGPLVVPGSTPCVRCLDLTRCRLDAGWPHLLAQLCLTEVAAEPTLLSWAAATALVQVRAWQSGQTPQAAGGSLELALDGFCLQTRSWPAHPTCGCLVPLG